MRFVLARMCPLMLWLTFALAALPLAFLIAAAFGAPLGGPALALVLIYGWVWTRFRPTAFVVHPHALEVIWPLKRREIRRDQIVAARLIDRQELRRQVGWRMRVGAGGLWGGFGWLWTERRGIVQMYVSRLDRFVWIERGLERPWLITPDQPEAFVDALTR
jgi:PH (Pleckstrin Homology) domain-containing protein